MQKDKNFKKVSLIYLESISEDSLTVPLLTFSKFKMAAGSHLEIQHKIQIIQNGYTSSILDLLDPMQPFIFLKNQSLTSKGHLKGQQGQSWLK